MRWRKRSSYNLSDCSEAHRQLERYLDSLKKKRRKTTFDPNFVQETIRRAERLKSTVRQMIDHPEEPSNQPVGSKPSSIDNKPPLPTTQSPSEPAAPAPEPTSTATTSSSEPTPDVAPPPEPTPDVALPSRPTPVKTLIQVFERSGLDISGSCTQLIQVIDKSLSSVLVRETYERVLDDLEARLDYEVTGEVE